MHSAVYVAKYISYAIEYATPDVVDYLGIPTELPQEIPYMWLDLRKPGFHTQS